MKIGITSQNFRTITAHAGTTSRFLVYSADADTPPVETDRLDPPTERAIQKLKDTGPPPVDLPDVVITAGCGLDFLRRMAARGIEVIATSKSDPLTAVTSYVNGSPLPPPEPHFHDIQ